MLDSFGKNTKINPFFYILYVRMAFCSWRRYTGEFKRINEEVFQEDVQEQIIHRNDFQDFSLVLSSDTEYSSSSGSSDTENQLKIGVLNSRKQFKGFSDNDEANRDDVEGIEEASSSSEFERIGERASEDERSENDQSMRKPAMRAKAPSRTIDKNLLSPTVKRVNSAKRETWGFTKSDDLKSDVINI